MRPLYRMLLAAPMLAATPVAGQAPDFKEPSEKELAEMGRRWGPCTLYAGLAEINSHGNYARKPGVLMKIDLIAKGATVVLPPGKADDPRNADDNVCSVVDDRVRKTSQPACIAAEKLRRCFFKMDGPQ